MAKRQSIGDSGPAAATGAEATPLSDNSSQQGSQQGGIQLKKELGLVDGVAIIVGGIIGAGIFVSPKGVLQQAGSTGFALVVWVISGLMSMVGALCYAELGTMIHKSGGDYAYVLESFGALPAFLYLWVALIIIVPAGNAILGLTFSSYILQPFWPQCEPPDAAVRLLSAAAIALLTAINCYNVKWTARIQDFFTSMKVLALVVIIIAGVVALCLGTTENLADPFEGTTTEPGKIVLAFYSGLFSYAGWNYLNFLTEEIKEPNKNLPRAICISLPLVTVIFTLANVAYFVVLTKAEVLASNAVAVTFGDRLLGVMAWIMPVFVACSTFGALNGAIFASSRLVFVGAREGHLPRALALINVSTYTPIPALIFLGLMSIVMLIMKDVYVLINYSSFVEASFWGVSVAGLIWLRYRDPKAERPIKVSLVFPILFLVILFFLVCVPIALNSASEIGVALIIVASGIPFFLVFIYWKNKPRWLKRLGAFGTSNSLQDGEDAPLLRNNKPRFIFPHFPSDKDRNNTDINRVDVDDGRSINNVNDSTNNAMQNP